MPIELGIKGCRSEILCAYRCRKAARLMGVRRFGADSPFMGNAERGSPYGFPEYKRGNAQATPRALTISQSVINCNRVLIMRQGRLKMIIERRGIGVWP